jgi:hypothetical protein
MWAVSLRKSRTQGVYDRLDCPKGRALRQSLDEVARWTTATRSTDLFVVATQPQLPCGHSQIIRVPCGSIRVIVNLA